MKSRKDSETDDVFAFEAHANGRGPVGKGDTDSESDDEVDCSQLGMSVMSLDEVAGGTDTDPTISVRVRDFAADSDDSEESPKREEIPGETVQNKEHETKVGVSPGHRVGLEDFDLLQVIGKGAYGKVYLVRKKRTGRLFAMKVLRKASITLHTKTAEHTQNERSILEQIQHPFIVKLWYAFQTPVKLFLILGYASGGELFTHLANEKMFSEDVAAFYIGELLLALEHLHSLGIIYRDLKPENVLLDHEGHVVLTDFGLSKVALETNTICGTTEFVAPEVLNSSEYSYAVDYWSLGVMLFDMLTGNPPFTGNNRKKVVESILKKKLVYPNYLSPFAKDLLAKAVTLPQLLQRNPQKRIGSGPGGPAKIKKHGFFRKVNWNDLAAKRCVPPIIPDLAFTEDTSNFHEGFTSMPLESPPNGPSAMNIPLNGRAGPGGRLSVDPTTNGVSLSPAFPDGEHTFRGFSFVADADDFTTAMANAKI
ncbi:Ribosomal protein S6 kinase beta-2 [Phlyctochytrium planicorne]|nr:Ribosomal protein S6 kinase beta-2 [Phlyctochytrium planicorne]